MILSAARRAPVIPIRIADWVVRFTTSTMVQGFDYAREHGAHVLSMSMGGLSSQALVDAVNLAYEAGVVHGHGRRQQLRRRPDAASRSCSRRATGACSRLAA